MMKTIYALVGCLAVAACSSTSGTSTSSTGSTTSSAAVLSNPVTNPVTLADLTFTTAGNQDGFVTSGVYMNGSSSSSNIYPSNNVYTTTYSSNGQTLYVTATDNSVSPPSTNTTTYTWNSTDKAYEASISVSGVKGAIDKLKIYVDPNNPNNYISVLYNGTTTVQNYASYGVSIQNPTPAAQFPMVGSATYDGAVAVTDQNVATADGTFNLTANFGNAPTVSGSIAINKGTAFGATSFGIAKGNITPTSTGTTFTSTVTKANGTAFTASSGGSSSINGTFSGTTGKDVAGTFNVDDSGTGGSGNLLAGVFTGVKQ